MCNYVKLYHMLPNIQNILGHFITVIEFSCFYKGAGDNLSIETQNDHQH